MEEWPSHTKHSRAIMMFNFPPSDHNYYYSLSDAVIDFVS